MPFAPYNLNTKCPERIVFNYWISQLGPLVKVAFTILEYSSWAGWHQKIEQMQQQNIGVQL